MKLIHFPSYKVITYPQVIHIYTENSTNLIDHSLIHMWISFLRSSLIHTSIKRYELLPLQVEEYTVSLEEVI